MAILFSECSGKGRQAQPTGMTNGNGQLHEIIISIIFERPEQIPMIGTSTS